MQPRAAVLKRSRGPDGRPNYSEDAASGISYSDEEARVAGRVSSDSDSEAAHADRSGSSQIGSMERESWAALMARSHANGGIGHHPGHPTGHQMQLHPAYPRESRFAQYREGEYYPEDSVPRAQGRHSHQAEPQFSGLHHASSLHRSGSYSGSGSNIRGGPQRSSSTSSHPSTPSTMHHGYPQTQYQTQHQSMYSQQRPPRPSSADPEVDAKRAAMARASNGHVGYTASFSSDGSGRAGYGQQGLGQGQLPASAARYGSSPSSGTRSWEQSRSAVDGSGYPHHLPVPNQHGLTLPQSNYSLMQASPHSPGASEEDEDRAPRDRLAVPAGAPQRDPSRSPDAGQVHHQPVPRRHHHLGSSGHGHPHSFSPYPRPESPRLNPTARYPSPSPNNHPQHSPGMGPNGSRNLPHIPDLQLGHGAVQHAHSHLQPHRHIPTPVSTSNSPALRPGENAYFDGPMSTQPLRGDSPEPSGGDDSMTLDALANVAMMRRMSVKNDPVLEDFGADGHGHGAMEDKDRRGALGFILN